MINLISYVVPWLGLSACLFVVLSHKVDTTCSIRIAKMVLWVAIWTIIAIYDYPYDALKAWSIMLVRLAMLTVNILYIVEPLVKKDEAIDDENIDK